ncbi:MAG: hypothetical protein AAGI71_10765 [Bacteroidota bacterium]
MAFSFSDADIARIAAVLQTPAKQDGTLFRFNLKNEEDRRWVKLEIQTSVQLPDDLSEIRTSNLVSASAPSSFLQLQDCTGFIASEELGEVIFFVKRDGTTNGLVVERDAGASLYANVEDRLLSADFMQLPPEMVMSSIALSMTESLFSDLRGQTQDPTP